MYVRILYIVHILYKCKKKNTKNILYSNTKLRKKMIDNGYFIILLLYKKSINESKKWERKKKGKHEQWDKETLKD